MKSIFYANNTRGQANHGWLTSRHTFSFANYYNPQRMGFGVLRVFNDDKVIGGHGFGTHPHNNMEIISIPLKGTLKHQDSMGNKSIIKQGDVQVMSAGTGIEHSEFNNSPKEDVDFLQLWITPNQKNVTPRYDQLSLSNKEIHNKLYEVISPVKNNDSLWIHQNAWFYLSQLDNGKKLNYQSKNNGLYLFVIDGIAKANEQILNQRDGYGLYEKNSIGSINLNITATQNCSLLLIDLPME